MFIRETAFILFMLLISTGVYIFSDMFCILDDDSVTKDKVKQREILGIVNVVTSNILMLGGCHWVIIICMAILIRQSYEDSICHEAYEIPLFIMTVISVIYSVIEHNNNKLYWLLCVIVFLLGMTRLFGKADMYAYITALTVMNTNEVYMFSMMILSSFVSVVVSIYVACKEKKPLRKVKVALLPIIYSSTILVYTFCHLIGFIVK